MRRYFESLRPANVSAIHSVPDGIFLVREDRAQYRWQAKALLRDPLRCPQAQASDRVLHDRPSVLHLQAMRKLSWFLRDFGYDSAGANLENEDPTVLLQSMARFFKFLPGDQRQAFLHEVTAKAS